MQEIHFSLVNLGCAKNLVDSEFIIGELLTQSNNNDYEYIFYSDPEDINVEYIIVNTCSFISSSRKEAEDTIKYLDELGKKVIITGCYLGVKDDNFIKSLENLEALVPFELSGNIKEIWQKNAKNKLKSNLSKYKKTELQKYLNQIKTNRLKEKAHIFGSENVRAFFTSEKGYEYLKISEGCNNNCSFCLIPSIRGRQHSRSIEDILQEVKTMINFGIKEIQIIAEDTTRYGTDLYGEAKLIELLEEIDKIDGKFKFRLFYMYPDILSLKHIEKLSKLKKFIPYFDMPFQHISPSILKKMGRFYDENHIYKLLDSIKSNFKNYFLHTNFIIGFPGETEEDFKKLLDFAKKIKFDSVSLFGYHDEKLASSYLLDNKVDDTIINKRVEKMSKLLNKIYDKKDKERKGREQIGFIEDINEKNILVRPELKAPIVDELDLITNSSILSKGKIHIGKKIKYIK